VTEKRGFVGYWIPAELALKHEISWPEKALLREIIQLDAGGECRASNKHFADHLGVSVRQVQNYLTHLEELRQIRRVMDGDRRVRIEPEGMNCSSTPHETQFTPPHEGSFTRKRSIERESKEEESSPEAKREPAPLKDTLQRAIDESFTSVQQYENFGKERGQIRIIAGRCRRLNPDDPEAVAKQMLTTFAWLREHDGWWAGQPFIPSVLSSQWERIAVKAKEMNGQKDWMAEFLAQRQDA